MRIYADILVIVNFYVDFFLLYCVRKFLKLKTGGGRLVLGALAGGICALIGLLPAPPWLSPLTGGLCALAAAAAAFTPVRPGLFFRCWLCAWLFSFLLAGFILFLTQFAPPGYMAVVGGAVYLSLSLPVLFVATCLAYGGFWLFGRVFPREASLELCRLDIEDQGRHVQVYAKADTGNALREPFSGLPVVICQASAIGDLAPPGAQAFWGAEEPPTGQGLRLIPFESVGGRGLLPAFKPSRVTQAKTGRELECYIALTQIPLSAGQFSALYNPDLFPE